MYLNIITPCSRPYNLVKIAESINIPRDNYRWIVVFDLEKESNLSSDVIIPKNCEFYFHKNYKSKTGNSQRNFAIDLIKDGHVYFNDDDTLMHPELWDNIKNLNNDFISFPQQRKNGNILLGKDIKVTKIDSHNFITSSQIIGESRFRIREYAADGYFAEEVYKKSKNPIWIDKTLSVYNQLRQ